MVFSPTMLFFFFTSRSLSVSNTNHYKGDTFNVFSLINSCGLSPENSFKLSKRLELKTPDEANAAIDLLRNYGFSQTQLCSLVKKRPSVLLSKPDKTLLPKLKFLHSIGFSTTDIPRILLKNPSVLARSLDKAIIPRCEIIRSLVRSDKEVLSTLKHDPLNLSSRNVEKNSVPNIEILRQLGLPQGSISLLVTNFPGVAFMKHSRFVEAVNTAKEMGFDPLKSTFVLAIQVLAKMNKAMWKSKIEVYEKWGWSRDICLLAFKNNPQCMMMSEKKIVKLLSFLVKDMGLCSEDIARYPVILCRSFEKIFIPRCAVVKILKSRGLIKSDLSITTFIMITEERFLERYVTRFQKSVPLLLDAYKGHKSN